METHELDIAIDTDGRMQVYIQGAKGPACLEYVRLVESIMATEGEVTHTAEFYEPPTGVEVKLEQELRN